MIGVPVPSLVQSDDAPFGSQRRRKRHEGESFHPMRVERDQNPVVTARIKVREGQAVVLKLVSFHVRTISRRRKSGKLREQRLCAAQLKVDLLNQAFAWRQI